LNDAFDANGPGSNFTLEFYGYDRDEAIVCDIDLHFAYLRAGDPVEQIAKRRG
jgi:hypothetical protein